MRAGNFADQRQAQAPSGAASSGLEPLGHDRPSIRQGSGGPSVSEAQSLLNEAHAKTLAAGFEGLDDAPLDVDGLFGAHTRAAVVSFQRNVFPLSPEEWDGIVGPKTWTALDAATIDPSLPSFCPLVAPSEAATPASSFQGGIPGLPPCQPIFASGTPPLLDFIKVTIPNPPTAQATSAIPPEMFLGTPTFSGAHYHGRVTGGPSSGGEIFFSQVIRSSLRETRIGMGLATDSISNELDGGSMYKSTTMSIGSGRNDVTETDTPGERFSSKAQDSRFTLHIKDEFELFLMWRSDPSAPTSKWLTYGSVNWSWEGTASGVTDSSAIMWLTPTEPFQLCTSLTLDGSVAIKNGTAKPATHLGLAVHLKGTGTPAAPVAAFPSKTDKDRLEKDCK